jgi:fission process protein 1
VPLSYAVAIGYVVVDTIDKGLKAYSNAGKELEEGVTRPDIDIKNLQLLLSLERATDTIVWQLLASVFVPGFTIHTVVQAVHAALLPIENAQPVKDAAAALASSVGVASADALIAVADKSIPTALGLAAIPFIVHPIDNAIHALLNVTLRPALKKFVCEQGKGKEAGLELCQDCSPWTRQAKKEKSNKH